MNYGEDLAYWYLRLNGFFPITNFVVHRSTGIEHTSDIDVLAVRTPHVHEEIGGQPHDWDQYLAASLRFVRPIGLVCEVKTGAYNTATLFRHEYVKYAVGRLGLTDQAATDIAVETLSTSPFVEVPGGAIIAKLFISTEAPQAGPYLIRTLAQVEDFIAERVRRYPAEKYAARMFFPQGVFQLIVAQVHRAITERN